MERFYLLFILIKITLSFNIQPNQPSFLQPDTENTGQPSFFGYDLTLGRDDDNILK